MSGARPLRATRAEFERAAQRLGLGLGLGLASAPDAADSMNLASQIGRSPRVAKALAEHDEEGLRISAGRTDGWRRHG